MVEGSSAVLVLKIADETDVARIVTLVESAYRGDSSRAGWTTEADLLDGQRTDEAAVLGYLGGPNSEVLLAVRGGELVACCQITRQSATVAYFGMFAVRPSLQGGGIGRWLIAEAERRVVERYRARTLRMTVIRQREELIAWYERLGYVKTGERLPFPYGDARFGIPRRDDLEFLVLEKQLPPQY